MAGEWRQTRLGDLVTLRGGLAYDGRLISDCGDALVTMGCVARGERFNAAGLRRYAGNASDLHRLGAGDLVIATRDVTQNRELIGAPAIVPAGLPGRPILATNMYRVINHSEVPTTFLYWLLRSPEYREHIVASAKGTTVVMITKDAVEDFRFRLPPLSEQRAIAHILDTLDDKIELNRRMSETLEAMARALFKAWFVDFEPVRAKMEGRWQRSQSLPGLPAHLYDLFPDRLVDSELGEIPEGWEVAKLGELLELAYGKALKEEDRQDGTIPVYGSNGQVGWHNEKLVTGPGIIVGRKGNPGVVKWVPTDFFPIDTTFYVVPKDKCPSLSFLFYALERQDLASLSADSAVPGLNRNLAYMSSQILPPRTVLVAFDSAVQPLFQRTYESERESRTLAALRDALLPKLIRGEIRVKDAEQFLMERGL